MSTLQEAVQDAAAERGKKIVMMRESGGLTFKEIAAVLGVSIPRAHALYKRYASRPAA
jgi:DNA-directed RNA polymerase specialized sigma subunit